MAIQGIEQPDLTKATGSAGCDGLRLAHGLRRRGDPYAQSLRSIPMPVCSGIQPGAVTNCSIDSPGRYAYALLRGQAAGFAGHWRNLLRPVLPVQQKPRCHFGMLCGASDPGGLGSNWLRDGRMAFPYHPIGRSRVFPLTLFLNEELESA